SGRDRGTPDNDLWRDFNFTTDGTFAIDLPNGLYNVTVTVGDALYPHDLQGIYLEGTKVAALTTAKGQFTTQTYPVTVRDGQLTLRLLDLGGDPYVVLNGLQVEAVMPAVARFDFGTATAAGK